MKETFEFTANIKKWLFIMMGTGLVGLAIVFLMYSGNGHARFWTNILANVYYFTGIGLFGLFAVSAATIAYGGWHTLVKRILLSLSGFTVIGGFLLLGILLLGYAHVHNLYEHVFEIVKDTTNNPSYTTKKVYFAPVFWISRVAIYAVAWAFASWGLNNFFARTDQTDPVVYKRAKLLAASFIVLFALTESAISWDMIMSLDPHWYSTLFGWYNFASYGCAAWAMTILLVIFLKSQGYLERVNENHVHDLGKLLFGFSIFWTYLWFDQFMLQWYANIPEETSFWVKRFNEGYFKFTIFFALIVNFLFPLFFLIKRSAKRNFRMIGFGAALLIFGHYVDFFNYTFVEPNWNQEAHEKEELAQRKGDVAIFFAQYEGAEHETAVAEPAKGAENASVGEKAEVKEVKSEGNQKAEKAEGKEKGEGEEQEINYAGIGLGEILVFIGFLGAFLYMFFNNLKKRPIIPENDPYLKENEQLVVTWA
ncbi:MAG: hypothetical protein U0V74_02895 [Chitinophagales bacterium]